MIWLKEIAIGLGVSLCIMLLMLALIRLDLAPYTAPPPLAFAAAMNLHPWAVQGAIVHYVYGIFWALLFLLLFRRRLTPGNGMLLGLLMWLTLMLAATPLIGWGMFGTRAADYARVPDDPLYLRSMPGFLVLTLLLNLLQGAMIGWLSKRWIGVDVRRGGRVYRRQLMIIR